MHFLLWEKDICIAVAAVAGAVHLSYPCDAGVASIASVCDLF
jgi:hypothetical protein